MDPPDGIYVVTNKVWRDTEIGQQLTSLFPFTKKENSTRWEVLPEWDGQLIPAWYPCAGNIAVAKWKVLPEWGWQLIDTWYPRTGNITVPVVEVFAKRCGTEKYEAENGTDLQWHRCST